MAAQDGRSDPIGVVILREILAIERLERGLPCPPAGNIPGQGRLETVLEAADDPVRRLGRPTAEPQRQDKALAPSCKIDLAGHRDIAPFGAIPEPGQPPLGLELPPAVALPDEADRARH